MLNPAEKNKPATDNNPQPPHLDVSRSPNHNHHHHPLPNRNPPPPSRTNNIIGREAEIRIPRKIRSIVSCRIKTFSFVVCFECIVVVVVDRLLLFWGVLTVGLLVPCASTTTTELLGLRTAVVGNEQCAVVLDKSLLELVLGVLVNVLLVVGDDGLGDGLADGVDLRGLTTTRNADANVDTGELVGTDDQDGLVDLFWFLVNLFFLRSSPFISFSFSVVVVAGVP